MPDAHDSAGGRHTRDRNALDRGDRLGPYEAAYDVRRGYDQPVRAPASRTAAAAVQLRGRRDDE